MCFKIDYELLKYSNANDAKMMKMVFRNNLLNFLFLSIEMTVRKMVIAGGLMVLRSSKPDSQLHRTTCF